MRLKETLTSAALAVGFALAMPGSALPQEDMAAAAAGTPTTPIQHLVIIFQENVSFDHYFATYPVAKNSDGSSFTPQPGTPSVNGLGSGMIFGNPNDTGSIGKPFRLSSAQAATCDQDHVYGDEQAMFDNGMMDNFLKFNIANCTLLKGDGSAGHPHDLIMGYYDGNTVTALWNYAQVFAMNDNSYGSTFGPSTPGAINVASGQTGGATQVAGSGDVDGGSVINDGQPAGDKCTTRDSVKMAGKNIGDLLNSAGVTWGFFQGGFDLTITNKNGTTGCARSSTSQTGAFPAKVDYIPHHEPFQYYASTANPNHTRPSSTSKIGSTDAANHQYDIHDFFDALAAGNMPAVSYLKAAGYQDGHAGYSSPLDEQTFIATTINTIELSPFWSSTAIVIAYDDSDGWYDHQMGPILMHSQVTEDNLTAPGMCGSSSLGMQGQGRCGYGPRLPLLAVSPWSKTNFVDHTLTDQSSVVALIEQNWGLGTIPNVNGEPGYDQFAGTLLNMFDFSQKKNALKKHVLFVDPSTGLPEKKPKG
jgi:phospholipase C